ncbi:4-hydroxy-2-oxovalerate aldolase [Desulfovibrio sp. 3_1_syn3]|uniref:4-hydroxy-2-oxovalerate aldolase n=1 Tax=Desulfovibrio sp. 3_1_syn3 TaxID=457398 RepID=UPI0003180224|nr:4-hydroxy-2-oxovalerate aldolase [Desulfovibrio sp. 3_1_syn3]EFL86111.2 4-hydroxy-2-oxovalerate aldolase [Desulfovibrio sp. 3_1_syn3]
MKKKIKILELCLRDGMHALRHKLDASEMSAIAEKLDTVGVDSIEFGHGNGLAGSSFQYGFSASSDLEYIQAVSKVVRNTPLSVIIIPGIGTREELRAARDHGVSIARFCTEMTENDIAEQHIGMAAEMGFETRATLPRPAAMSVEDTVFYAKRSESYGAKVVYIMDGGGSMLPDMVYDRTKAMREALKPETEIGFHGHNNLQLAVANSIAAVQGGATHVDCTMKGMGAGAGNCPTEIFAAVLDRMGCQTGIDLYKAMDVADDVVKPLFTRMISPMAFDKDSLMLGYAGTYSSFLLFAKRAAARYGVDARDVIRVMGERGCTEGQENLCIECAYELARAKGLKVPSTFAADNF